MTRKECQSAFFDNLGFAVDPNWGNVKAVIIINHRDCAAFRRWLNVTDQDPIIEEKAHRADCETAIKLIVGAHSELASHVEAWLLPIEPQPIQPTSLANG